MELSSKIFPPDEAENGDSSPFNVFKGILLNSLKQGKL